MAQILAMSYPSLGFAVTGFIYRVVQPDLNAADSLVRTLFKVAFGTPEISFVLLFIGAPAAAHIVWTTINQGR